MRIMRKVIIDFFKKKIHLFNFNGSFKFEFSTLKFLKLHKILLSHCQIQTSQGKFALALFNKISISNFLPQSANCLTRLRVHPSIICSLLEIATVFFPRNSPFLTFNYRFSSLFLTFAWTHHLYVCSIFFKHTALCEWKRENLLSEENREEEIKMK